jgi:hypothetical protein
MMSQAQRRRLLIALLTASIGIVLFVDPIPQDLAYHDFADKRGWLGIPNFGDVISNIGFLVVGALALFVLVYRYRELFRSSAEARPYLTYFVGVTLVGLGSGYYHWEPSNASLLWDRLPMSIAFMAISAAVVADRINTRAGNGWVLAVLLVLGLSSLFYWHWTESLGRGDLRFYGLVQFYRAGVLRPGHLRADRSPGQWPYPETPGGGSGNLHGAAHADRGQHSTRAGNSPGYKTDKDLVGTGPGHLAGDRAEVFLHPPSAY